METSVTKYLHTMIRVSDPEATVRFFELIGLKEVRRYDNTPGRHTLIFLAVPGEEGVAEVELTWNWDPEVYPDMISVELLQAGDALPPREPWASMQNIGEW